MKITRAFIPNIATILNMFFGYISITYALKGRFIAAAWFIILATLLDFLDGKLARLTDSSSQFGIEFDSLADIITFGMAPAFLVYNVYFSEWGKFGVVISFFPLLFSGIRLARFNVQEAGIEKKMFSGLPTPTAATLLSSFVIFTHDIWGVYRFPQTAMALVLLSSFLMISHIEYDVIPNLSVKAIKESWIKPVTFIVGSITIVLYPKRAFFLWVVVFILFGILRWIILLFTSEDEETAMSIRD